MSENRKRHVRFSNNTKKHNGSLLVVPNQNPVINNAQRAIFEQQKKIWENPINNSAFKGILSREQRMAASKKGGKRKRKRTLKSKH
jgi:hypothetical protein